MKSTVYIHIRSFTTEKETFHKKICKLVVTMEWLFIASIYFPHGEMNDECVSTRLFNTLLCILPKCFCGRKCLRDSQFVISKQRHRLEQYSLLFPISFLSGTLLYLINCVSCGSSHSIVGQIHQCIPPLYGKSAAAQTQQSKERWRHIEPIEPDTWCNAAAIYPQSHISQKLPPQRERGAAISPASRYEGRFCGFNQS